MASNPSAAFSRPPTGGTDFLQVEYTGPEQSIRLIRGPVTGQPYRFGAGELDRVKYVDKRDIERFETLPDFAVQEPAGVA